MLDRRQVLYARTVRELKYTDDDDDDYDAREKENQHHALTLKYHFQQKSDCAGLPLLFQPRKKKLKPPQLQTVVPSAGPALTPTKLQLLLIC